MPTSLIIFIEKALILHENMSLFMAISALLKTAPRALLW